jgi:hypothetical protein
MINGPAHNTKKLGLDDQLNFIHFLDLNKSRIGEQKEWAKLRLLNGYTNAASKIGKLLNKACIQGAPQKSRGLSELLVKFGD